MTVNVTNKKYAILQNGFLIKIKNVSYNIYHYWGI